MSPPTGARVLDFGCGTGQLLDAFQAHGWETFGIEPAVDDAFRTHGRLFTVPGEPTFDLIVVHHVLEHLTNPLELLRQFARASRVGGFLFISVPRFDTLPIHRDYRYVLNGRAHITAYTWPCLRTLLARSGWAPVADPPAEISKGGGGRRTTSRLRVLARRVNDVLPELASPAAAARAALHAYYAADDGRRLLARIGLLRMAARQVEMERRRAKAVRKRASGPVSDAEVIRR
jgi:SAM-dependent methyltransferase